MRSSIFNAPSEFGCGTIVILDDKWDFVGTYIQDTSFVLTFLLVRFILLSWYARKARSVVLCTALSSHGGVLTRLSPLKLKIVYT